MVMLIWKSLIQNECEKNKKNKSFTNGSLIRDDDLWDQCQRVRAMEYIL